MSEVDEIRDTVPPGAEAPASEGSVAEEPEDRRSRLESIIESVLFVAGAPISLRKLVEILKGPGTKEVKAAVSSVARSYAGDDRGIHLVEVAGGYQFRTASENAEWVRAMLRERPARLGRATLETLAIIAYKQPVTRAEIEAVRGVDADSAVSSLLAKRLIKIAGRKETVGRPLIYVTAPEFLEAFGLRDLRELPALKEIGPVPEEEHAEGDEGRTPAEDLEPGGDQFTPPSGGDDSRREGAGERAGGDGTGDEGGPEPGSHCG